MTRGDYALAETMKAVKVGNYWFTGKVLGKGAFAVVEEAVHVLYRVKVSVKKINLYKTNPYVEKHLLRESTVLRQLNHPHIVRLFETFKYNFYYCLVTELVGGGDLCAFLQQQKGRRLEELAVRKFSRQIAAALAYMHEKNIVHRDLKLENVMLDSEKKNVKLVDFGLTSHWDSAHPLKTLCGSPEYCAPELFMFGTQYGTEVDMWSLGVVIYAMAVGQLPFPCVSSLMKIPEKKSQFIKLINKGLSNSHIALIKGYPPEFATLLKKLMNPSWKDRINIFDTLKDDWLSNGKRWAPPLHESPDIYDLQYIQQRVCKKLSITPQILHSELNKNPVGEISAIYNIAVYKWTQEKNKEVSPNSARITSTVSQSFSKSPSSPGYRTTKVSNKLWVVGAAQKINEVVRNKKTRSIYTSSSTCSSNQTSRKGSAGCDSEGREGHVSPNTPASHESSDSSKTPEEDKLNTNKLPANTLRFRHTSRPRFRPDVVK